MSENGAKPSVQALDAFSEWMRRVESDLELLHARVVDMLLGDIERNRKLVARIEALEAMHRDADKQPPKSTHWNDDYDATVQLRRDVGQLVAAARMARRALNTFGANAGQTHAIGVIDEALKLFEGDYT